MKKILIFQFCLFMFSGFSQTPTWQWAKRVGSFGDNTQTSSDESFNDVKLDKAGSIYAVGNFYANTAFQNAQLFGQTTPLGYGQDDAYLMKYNSCGSLLWYRRMGGTNVDGATSLVVDNQGKIVVTGYSFSSPSVFYGGTNTITINGSNTNGPQFIAKFDSSGTLLTLDTYPYVYNMLFETSQNSLLITNGLFAVNINSIGAVTSTIALFSPTTATYPTINAVTLDENDNIYIGGGFNTSVTLNSGNVLSPTPSTLFAGMAANSLVVKYNSVGNLQWFQRGYSNGAGDVIGGCAVDTSGNKLCLGGRVWNNSSVFGYNSNSGVGTYANPIYFMNANSGTLISASTCSVNLQGSIYPIKVDHDNRIYMKGRTNGWMSLGTTTVSVSPASNWQNVIANFDANNNFGFLSMLPQTGSAPGNDDVYGLDISEQGNVYLVGMFGGTLDSAGTAVNKLGGSEDGFVAKFGFPCTSTTSILSPLAPTNLSALYQGSLTNLVNWVDNSNYESGFELWYNGPTPTFSLLTTLPANTTSYTHTALNYSTTYCYAARAINNIGPSVFTNTDCASTPAMTAPQAPTSLVAANTGTLSNTVNWVDNSFNETSFELWYHDASPTFSLLATLPANTTTYTHTGLSYTTTYCYKALATNSIGPSVFTNTDCATTPQAPLPDAPTNLTAANTGTLVNTVNWIDNSNNETSFELWYHDASPTFSLLTTLPANTTTYTHTNLSYTTTYCYKALATNSVGSSVFTNTDCATTPAEQIVDETGIAKQTLTSGFMIYPNPTSGQVFIEGLQSGKELSIKIYDALGALRKQELLLIKSNQQSIQLPTEKGIYFIELSQSNKITMQKVVVE